jgi:hypothetical protein
MTGARLRLASNIPLIRGRLPGPQLPATAARQIKDVTHNAVAMFDACTLQGFNNDIRDRLAHCIRTLL